MLLGPGVKTTNFRASQRRHYAGVLPPANQIIADSKQSSLLTNNLQVTGHHPQ